MVYHYLAIGRIGDLFRHLVTCSNANMAKPVLDARKTGLCTAVDLLPSKNPSGIWAIAKGQHKIFLPIYAYLERRRNLVTFCHCFFGHTKKQYRLDLWGGRDSSLGNTANVGHKTI